MEPVLPSGALVIARPIGAGDRLHPGDVVLAKRPDRPALEIIKRIHSIDAAGTIFLVGDNRASSTDSREFGVIAPDQIVARLRWRYWPLPPKRL